jgi:mannose-1-phosphate guanylyltransferase
MLLGTSRGDPRQNAERDDASPDSSCETGQAERALRGSDSRRPAPDQDESPSRAGGAAGVVTNPGGDLWAVVLAGGQGLRLRALTRRVCGDERPKQFAPLLGSRSLLRATLDRAGLAIPSARTVVVAHASHAGYLADERARGPLPRLLVQPADRGTAAAILLAAHWVSWRDPEATIALFPSDHFVGSEREFMDRVLGVAAFVQAHPGWMVLLGAAPGGPETEYGWIEPGAAVGEVIGEPVHRVLRFVEKPARDEAEAMLAGGWLWNTLVLLVRLPTLLAAGRQALPVLSERLARIEPFADSDDEAWAVQQAYRLASEANFSRAVLEGCAPILAVSRLPAAVRWSDWGTPDRVLRSLRGAKVVPPWLSDADRRGAAIA